MKLGGSLGNFPKKNWTLPSDPPNFIKLLTTDGQIFWSKDRVFGWQWNDGSLDGFTN
jgi:hypothetical protein